ncbi:MAG: DUF4272 domain-containing protein [Polyangiaceae bacterium]
MLLIARREQVRSANLARLRSMGFAPVNWMPLREHRAVVRPSEEIARRAVALAALGTWITHGESIAPSSEVRAHVARSDLRDALEAEERELLEGPRELADTGDPIWDAVAMLGWVLGLDHEPSADGSPLPSESYDEIVRWLYRGGDVHPSTLVSRVRSAEEIVPLEDLFTCAHQSSRLMQLGFAPGPKRADHVRIEIRRHALSWVLSPGLSWAEVDLGS